MARIAGVDIPKNKRGVIALTYIFGLGRSRAIEILEKAQVSQDTKVQDWNDDEIGAIRDAVSYYTGSSAPMRLATTASSSQSSVSSALR